ncbi:hypothetical protein EON63_13210, partial [archaeon]
MVFPDTQYVSKRDRPQRHRSERQSAKMTQDSSFLYGYGYGYGYEFLVWERFVPLHVHMEYPAMIIYHSSNQHT